MESSPEPILPKLSYIFYLCYWLSSMISWPSLVTTEQDSPWRPRLMIQGAVFTGESIHHSTCDIFLLDICLNGVFSIFRTIRENHTQWLIRLLDYISDSDVVFLESHELYYLPGHSFERWPTRWKASLSLFWFNDIHTIDYDMCWSTNNDLTCMPTIRTAAGLSFHFH